MVTERDRAIADEAENLGISLTGFPRTNGPMDYSLLQQRIEEFNAARRAGRMWLFSIVSAVASVFAAAAAWILALKP